MNSDDKTLSKYWLKSLKEQGTDLTYNELNWLVIFENQLKDKGFLSKKQMVILEEIYKRRT